MNHQRMAHVDVGGIRLYVQVVGKTDASTLLFLHGLTDSSAYVEWIVSRLSDAHRVVTLDFRGHGRSDRAEHYETPDFVGDAIAACEQVAGTRCAVIAHSFGGLIGAALAQQRPDLVRAIFLEDPLLVDPGVRTDLLGEDGEYSRETFAGAEAHLEMIARWQQDGLTPEQAAAEMAALPSPLGVTWAEGYFEESIHALAEGKLRFDLRVLEDFEKARVSREADPVFDPSRPIEMPGFLLAGDPSVPGVRARPIDVERLRSTSPGISHETVEGAGHFIHGERHSRDAYVDALTRFLADTRSVS